MPESKTSPRRISAKEKAAQALQLRKRGFTYAAIAKALGYKDKTGAAAAVARELEALTKEPAEQLRALELERLDALLQGLWPQASKGNARAAETVLRIMERRAKLLGLDMPAKVGVEVEHVIKGYVSVSPDDWPAPGASPGALSGLPPGAAALVPGE